MPCWVYQVAKLSGTHIELELSIPEHLDSRYFKSVTVLSVELHTTTSDVPVLFWRSVGNSPATFVMETMFDELATLAEKIWLKANFYLTSNTAKYRIKDWKKLQPIYNQGFPV